MRNILIDLVTKSYLSKAMMQRITQEGKVDSCYMVLAHKAETEEYEEFGTCYFREELAQGIINYSPEDMACSLPIDEKIISYMEPYFIEILNQQRRFEEYHDFHISSSYENHYTILMRNLFFWNDFLEKKHITHLFVTSIPHEGYDSIIYHLCKMKGIAVQMMYNSTIPFRQYPTSDYLNVEEGLWDEYTKLRAQYKDAEIDEILLEGDTEKIFQKWSSKDSKQMTPWYILGNPLKQRFRTRFGVTNLWTQWMEILGSGYKAYNYQMSWEFLKREMQDIPLYVKAIPQVYRRWRYAHPVWKRTVALNKFYESIAEEPVPGEKYIYFALHYQPEASSNPLGGGVYTDQIFAINLLAQSVPQGIKIYVKSHPEQLAPLRSKAYYEDIKKIPNVRLLKMRCNTFDIMKNAFAVSSLTGTACWECQFFDIPAILFGYSHKNLAPLSYPVRTFEECQRAMHDIANHAKECSLKDLKLMTKAMHNISYGPEEKEEKLPQIVIDFILGKKTTQI